MVGVILDFSGGMSNAGWRAAFLAVGVLMLLALIAFALMRPRELIGDKGR
jgi:predicted MFS family arabinose efflux permease